MPHTPAQQKRAKARFLAELVDGATVVAACENAKVPRRTVYDWRRDDPDFAQAWADAYEHGTDLLEAEAYRRAVEGVDKPVTIAGKREIVKEYSDTLLIFQLKARRPNVYRDNARIEHTGADGGPVQITDDRSASLADVLAVLKATGATDGV